MQTIKITILLGISLGCFTTFTKFAFDMRRDEKYSEMAFWGFVALLPGFVSAVYLTTTMGVPVSPRNWILGSLGGLTGIFLGVWLGYVFGGNPAIIAPEVGASPPSALPTGSVNVTGAGNVTSIGQQGGVTANTYSSKTNTK